MPTFFSPGISNVCRKMTTTRLSLRSAPLVNLDSSSATSPALFHFFLSLGYMTTTFATVATIIPLAILMTVALGPRMAVFVFSSWTSVWRFT